jgi:hypothetical protein
MLLIRSEYDLYSMNPGSDQIDADSHCIIYAHKHLLKQSSMHICMSIKSDV